MLTKGVPVTSFMHSSSSIQKSLLEHLSWAMQNARSWAHDGPTQALVLAACKVLISLAFPANPSSAPVFYG